MSVRRILGTLFTAFISVCAGPAVDLSGASASTSCGVVVHETLGYSNKSENLRLDLFLPHKRNKFVPCVIVIPGGAFLSQDGKGARTRQFAESLAVNGFAAAVIAYRGRPDHTYQTTLADTKAAVRFIRTISNSYSIDPDRIGAMGSSAGATLAVLLAVTGGNEQLEGDGLHGNPPISSRVQAAVGISGVYDFVSRFSSEEQILIQPRVSEKIKSNGDWIGTPFSPASDQWQQASAINHLDASDQPILVIHCKDDEVVPWMQSRDFHKKMKEAGIVSELVICETGGHGGPPNAMKMIVRFFKKVLLEKSSSLDVDKKNR